MGKKASRATKHGSADATSFIQDRQLEESTSGPDERGSTLEILWLCLTPGALEPDESLINVLGFEKTAKLFGVKYGGRAWEKALAEYNVAWRMTVVKAIKTIEDSKK